jgi:ribonuclease Z
LSETVRIETPRFTVEGNSRAGVETWFRVKELGVALDIGRCPDLLVGTRHVFISHAHIDHSSGIPFYATQRKLNGLDPGIVYVPVENLEDYESLIRVHERLQNTRYQLTLAGLGEGDVVELRRDLVVRVHRASHGIVTNAFELVERRTKLLPEHAHLSSDEIRERRAQGEDLFEQREVPILFYTGDTDRAIFETCDAMFRAEVLIMECTFTRDDDQPRAEKYMHIHIDDIASVADRFRNDLVILSHFSLRDSKDEIAREVERRLPGELMKRVRLAL